MLLFGAEVGFFSSHIFAILREKDIAYVHIFLITALMYILGVIWYNYLINQYNKENSLKLE
jgi:hypothetical protein